MSISVSPHVYCIFWSTSCPRLLNLEVQPFPWAGVHPRRTPDFPELGDRPDVPLRLPCRVPTAAPAINPARAPAPVPPPVDCCGTIPLLGNIIRGRATTNFPDLETRPETSSIRPAERPRPPSPLDLPARRPPRRRRLIIAGQCPLFGHVFRRRVRPNRREGADPKI